MPEKIVKGRLVQKHDTQSHWELATTFIPKQGELIVYDIDDNYSYERLKIGDGVTLVNDLPFAGESSILSSMRVVHGYSGDLLSDIIETYILSIDYDDLSFDTAEIVVSQTDTTSVLGQAILGQMMLA